MIPIDHVVTHERPSGWNRRDWMIRELQVATVPSDDSGPRAETTTADAGAYRLVGVVTK